jgi:hypothetical protein
VPVFGLAGLPAAVGQVRELVPGGTVCGDLVAIAGPDLHLATGNGVVVLDTRLMTGWQLAPAAAGGEPTVPVSRFKPVPGEQQELF